MQKALQKFLISDEAKFVSSLLASHFKLSARMSPKTIDEREYISHVPYASAVGSPMYAMVCTRPDLSQVYNPGRGHWEAVR